MIGSSNDPDKECYTQRCNQDNIKILKRYGGGGAVVLHPGCVIITIGLWVKSFYKNKKYFDAINNSIIDLLKENYDNLDDLILNGLSDISYKDRKILGSSMFRSKNYLLYQGSLLIDKKIKIIQKYLKHPSKEPLYRGKKSHDKFLIGLNEIIKNINTKSLIYIFNKRLQNHIEKNFKGELSDFIADQYPNLIKRIKKNHSYSSS